MYKIYSRPRIRLPKIDSRNLRTKEKIKKIRQIRIIIIMIIAILTANMILNSISPIFDKLCENKAKSIATIISNEEATNVMKNYEYEDLFNIQKDTEGNITMVKSNIIPINEIISDVANKIQIELNNKGKENIEIPLGSFTGSKYLSGKGPGVNMSIVPIGNIETDLRSEFTAEGINQTLHRVYLQVKCEVSVLTPIKTIDKEITNQVLLLENIIVGKIPDTYYNLEGMNSGDTMEVIE